MLFKGPLLTGKLVKRYKRFLADIILDTGEEITAHCANSGSMLGLMDEGSRVWVTKVPDEVDRKLRYDWHLVQPEGVPGPVGINTSHPNKLVHEALLEKKIKLLKAYNTIKPEVKYGSQNSRIDFFLTQEGLPDCYVEVKNVTLLKGYALQFPDAVTTRGAKHLEELMEMVAQGHRAVVIYTAQRQDGTHFETAKDIDPHYATTAALAQEKGVEFYCMRCAITDTEIRIADEIKII